MNKDLSSILSLKKIMESAGAGEGFARSAVEELRGNAPNGSASARLLLLGYPLDVSLEPLAEASSEEVSLLVSLIVAAPKSSALLVGRKGASLATTVERWVKARENEALEQKVQRFRGLVSSGVLGAVTAMLSSLGPLVGNLDFNGPSVGSGSLIFAAVAMTVVSSGMLGLFLSGRTFFVNVLVSMAAFAVVSSAVAPLANIPSVGLWGVK